MQINEEKVQLSKDAFYHDHIKYAASAATAQNVHQTCCELVDSLYFLNFYDMLDLCKTLLAFRDRQAVKPRYVGILGEETPSKL